MPSLLEGEQLRDLGRKPCSEEVLDWALHRGGTGCFHQRLGEINHWIQSAFSDELEWKNICETSKF